MRGDAHRAAIRVVLDAFGENADEFVVVGGCALGLYARSEGSPLRVTKDVDCISRVTPWVLQEKTLADLCTRGVLSPVPEVQCRYRINRTEILVDVLSPEGMNVGGVIRWFKRAVERPQTYPLGDGRSIKAVTPPYFVATKLVAFADRGPDILESRDAEDIVAVAVEIENLVEQVSAEGISAEIADLWVAVFNKYKFDTRDMPDFVDSHLHRDDQKHRTRVAGTLTALSTVP